MLLGGKWLNAYSICALCKCSNTLKSSITSSSNIAIILQKWKQELMRWHNFVSLLRGKISTQEERGRFYCPPDNALVSGAQSRESDLSLIYRYLLAVYNNARKNAEKNGAIFSMKYCARDYLAEVVVAILLAAAIFSAVSMAKVCGRVGYPQCIYRTCDIPFTYLMILLGSVVSIIIGACCIYYNSSAGNMKPCEFLRSRSRAVRHELVELRNFIDIFRELMGMDEFLSSQLLRFSVNSSPPIVFMLIKCKCVFNNAVIQSYKVDKYIRGANSRNLLETAAASMVSHRL